MLKCHKPFSLGVLVLAATNPYPHTIDSALRRPGRLDVQLCVPPPDKTGRPEVLRVHVKMMPLAADVDLQDLVERARHCLGKYMEAEFLIW
jgi:transitional endoplasmic reticulum ATPase